MGCMTNNTEATQYDLMMQAMLDKAERERQAVSSTPVNASGVWGQTLKPSSPTAPEDPSHY